MGAENFPHTTRRVVVLEGVDPDKINNSGQMRKDFGRLINLWGLNIVLGPIPFQFIEGGHGAMIMAFISQSHVIGSSVPEDRRLEIDIGTCGNDQSLEELLEPSLITTYRPDRMVSELNPSRIVGGQYFGTWTKRERIYERMEDYDPTIYPNGRWKVGEMLCYPDHDRESPIIIRERSRNRTLIEELRFDRIRHYPE